MGLFDAIFNPNKSGEAGFESARNQYNIANAQTNPFYNRLIESGTNSVGAGDRSTSLLADLLGANGRGTQGNAYANYSTGPGYDFKLQAGTDAIDQSAAARGMLQSGATLKALQEYGQGLHNQDFGDYLSRLAGLSNLGAQGAQIGATGARGIVGNAMNQANLFKDQGQYADQTRSAGFGNLVGLGGSISGFGSGGRYG